MENRDVAVINEGVRKLEDVVSQMKIGRGWCVRQLFCCDVVCNTPCWLACSTRTHRLTVVGWPKKFNRILSLLGKIAHVDLSTLSFNNA